MRKKDITNDLHKKFIKKSHLNNNFTTNTKPSMFHNGLIVYSLKNSFEIDAIDDTEETSEKLRYKDNKPPVKII